MWEESKRREGLLGHGGSTTTTTTTTTTEALLQISTLQRTKNLRWPRGSCNVRNAKKTFEYVGFECAGFSTTSCEQ